MLVHFANNMPKTPYSTLLYIALDTLSQPNTTVLSCYTAKLQTWLQWLKLYYSQ